MSEPLVTIALAVYNVEKYLRRSLDCICNQTYRNLEILCINDGSTDSSPAILEEYAAKDKRIKNISQPNGGLASVRNLSIDHASGKYLQMLDSDDIFEPDMVRCMVARAEEQEADIVVCATVTEEVASGKCLHNEQTNMLLAKQRLNLLCCRPACEAPADFFRIFAWGCVWDKLFRVDFLRKHQLRFHGFQPAEDFPFTYTALILAERVSLIDSLLLYYQVYVDSLCHRGNRDITQVPKSSKMLWVFMLQQGISGELEQAYFPRVAYDLFWNVCNKTVTPRQVCSYIDSALKNFPFLRDGRFGCASMTHNESCAKAIFCPEICLLLPELSASKQPELLRAVSQIAEPAYAAHLPVRILYAQEDETPLPFEQICYPIAMPVQVPVGATTQQRLKACRSVNLPDAELEIWPGCSPAPILKKLRQCRMEMLRTRLKGFFSFDRAKRNTLKARKRALRTRMRSLKHLLEIVQS